MRAILVAIALLLLSVLGGSASANILFDGLSPGTMGPNPKEFLAQKYGLENLDMSYRPWLGLYCGNKPDYGPGPVPLAKPVCLGSDKNGSRIIFVLAERPSNLGVEATVDFILKENEGQYIRHASELTGTGRLAGCSSLPPTTKGWPVSMCRVSVGSVEESYFIQSVSLGLVTLDICVYAAYDRSRLPVPASSVVEAERRLRGFAGGVTLKGDKISQR